MSLKQIDRAESAERAAERMNALLCAIHPTQAAYVTGSVPEKMRRVFAEAFNGDSRTKAIKAKCLSCCDFIRAEVAACSVITCPLHSVRPFQSAEEDE